MEARNRYGAVDRPAVTALRLVFGALLVVALVLGYVGIGQLVAWSRPPWDLLYFDLQLFVLGADPLQDHDTQLPVTLQIARFAAPAVTVYAVVEAGRLIFAAEWRRIRARHARKHVILCGDGAIAAMLARRLRTAGRRVVLVNPRSATPPDGAAPLTVIGDARDPDVLRAAGVHHATAVFACSDDSVGNTAIALAAGQTRADASFPLAVYAHIRDPELCLTLQARYLGLPHPPGLRLDFFNIDDLAARKLFTSGQLDPVDGQAPRLLVAGATPFGRAVLVEAARRWRLCEPRTAPPLPVTVIDPNGTAAVAELVHRYPFLPTVCRFTVYDADLLELLGTDTVRDPPELAIICYDDEEHALKTALTVERLWQNQLRSVVIRLDRLAAFRGAGHADNRLFDQASSRLRVFGAVNAACDPGLIGEGLVERLARAVHDRYRLACRADGESIRSNRAMANWEELSADLQESNRAQARDIGRKLREIGCVLVPRVRADGESGLGDDEIERLAKMEHDRWLAERSAGGWRYADKYDSARRLHPGLQDWEQLSHRFRRRNTDAVRDLPGILADAGFQVVRGELAFR